jgi:hypothetical protein
MNPLMATFSATDLMPLDPSGTGSFYEERGFLIVGGACQGQRDQCLGPWRREGFGHKPMESLTQKKPNTQRKPKKNSKARCLMTAYRSTSGTLVHLDRVRPKPGWQSVHLLNEEKVQCMMDLMLRKESEFPPIEVEEIGGGSSYFILDGHHRVSASQRCSFTEIPIKIVRI